MEFPVCENSSQIWNCVANPACKIEITEVHSCLYFVHIYIDPINDQFGVFGRFWENDPDDIFLCEDLAESIFYWNIFQLKVTSIMLQEAFGVQIISNLEV